MKSQFENYLNSGTDELINRLSSTTIDNDEKKALVQAFLDVIANRVNAEDSFIDLDYIFECASLKHIDALLYSADQSIDGDYDYDKSMALVNRYLSILRGFQTKNWPLPDLLIQDLNVFTSNIEARKTETSCISAIIKKDHELDDIFDKLNSKPDLETCDKATKLVYELKHYLEISQKQGYKVPNIHNSDYNTSLDQVNAARKTIEKNADLESRIVDNDVELLAIELSKNTNAKQWNQAVLLCQEQASLLETCKDQKIKPPKIKCTGLQNTKEKYEHFLKMTALDKTISKIGEIAETDEEYAEIAQKCKEQEKNIEKCQQNSWSIPLLANENPRKYSKRIQKSIKHRILKKKARRVLIIFAIIVVGIIGVFIFGIYIYRKGKCKIPFDNEHLICTNYSQIEKELRDAGFVNISTEPVKSGWKKDDIAIGLRISDTLEEEIEGSYYKPETPIIIEYSSDNRVDVTNLASNWRNQTIEELQDKLEEAGFKNIVVQEEQTQDKSKAGLITRILFNSLEYNNGECYIPVSAPIELTYYEYKIDIGKYPSDFIGKDYNIVVDELKDKGFNNISIDYSKSGLSYDNTIIKVLVGNSDIFGPGSFIAPDENITVIYSSAGRIDASPVLADWKQQDYSDVLSGFNDLGLNNVTVTPVDTRNKEENRKIQNIVINEEQYDSGNCYVPKDAFIDLSYYNLAIVMPSDEDDFIHDKDYDVVETELKKLGFENIMIERKSGFWANLFHHEYEVESIKINGEEEFKQGDVFRCKTPIVVVIYSDKDPIECPNCGADLALQKGFSDQKPYWICLECGQMLINPDVDSTSDIAWFCNECGDMLNVQDGFTEETGEWKCKKCGFINNVDPSTIH